MKKEIIEGNKLIAEFMGYKLSLCNNGMAWDIGASIPSKDHPLPIQGLLHTKNELKLHSSWDWLMPVVERIDTIDDYAFTVIIHYHYTEIVSERYELWIDSEDNDGRLKSTWLAVVEFIEWYNKQK